MGAGTDVFVGPSTRLSRVRRRLAGGWRIDRSRRNQTGL